MNYYETTDQLLEPLLLCYESLVLLLFHTLLPSNVVHNYHWALHFSSNHVDLGC